MRSFLHRGTEVILITAVVAALGWIGSTYWWPVRVAGGSMRPALYPGDLVIVDVRSSVARGAIALIESPRHGRVLHRVIGGQPGGHVRTQGDANATADSESLPSSAVIGPVVAVVPVGRLVERWQGDAVCATMTAQ